MTDKVRLIRYRLIDQLEEVNEIPKGVEMIQAPKIWKETRGEGITIAILDTGCDTDHPDLSLNIIGGKNFTDDDNGNPDIFEDYNGHGTHVAGTIAAKQNNHNKGVTGVAPEAKLLILKVLGEDGSGRYEWIIDAIHYAIDQKADIITMSLGGTRDVPELYEAIKKAVMVHQIPVVCAAGNEGDGDHHSDEYTYPGSYNEVISVGAIDLNRNSSDFTNSNNQIDLVAPGEKITSTFLDGTYATLSGTSMATPHITGSLALLKNLTKKYFERNLTEAELYAQLIRRTLPLGYSAKIEGNGMVYLTLMENIHRIAVELRNQLYDPLF
jgi:major intracellular serine protease